MLSIGIKHIQNLFIALVAAATLMSCSEEQLKRLEVTPTAYGSVDNMLLVCDNYFWEDSDIGDTLRAQFEALYPVTPQPEPILDLRQVPSKEFNKVLKTHRAIVILADLSDVDEPSTKLVRQTLGAQNVQRAMTDPQYRIAIQRDRWAKGQTVIYWFAPNRQMLFETISRDYQRIISTINTADAQKLINQVYFPGENVAVNNSIVENFGFELKIPNGFVVGNQDSVSLWLRKETDKVSSNIFIYIIDNPKPFTLSPDSLQRIRNRLTTQYFSTWIEGSYMQIDDKNLPVYYQQIQFGEYKALQARGIWFMVNDFMGGPFVTYLIPDPNKNRIILVDGFVHAPGQKKRPEMRKLDTVFSTFKFGKEK